MLFTNSVDLLVLEKIKQEFKVKNGELSIIVNRLLTNEEEKKIKQFINKNKFNRFSLLHGALCYQTENLPQILTTDTVVVVPGGTEVAYLHLASGYGVFCPLYYAYVDEDEVSFVQQTFHKSLPIDLWYVFVITGCKKLVENAELIDACSNKILQQDLNTALTSIENVLSKVINIHNKEIKNILGKVFDKNG